MIHLKNDLTDKQNNNGTPCTCLIETIRCQGPSSIFTLIKELFIQKKRPLEIGMKIKYFLLCFIKMHIQLNLGPKENRGVIRNHEN